MDPIDQFDREEEELRERYERGEISQNELDDELRELRHAYQAEAERAAFEAQQDALRDWYGPIYGY